MNKHLEAALTNGDMESCSPEAIQAIYELQARIDELEAEMKGHLKGIPLWAEKIKRLDAALAPFCDLETGPAGYCSEPIGELIEQARKARAGE